MTRTLAAPSTITADAPVRWSLTRLFLLRVAGLPIETALDLRFTDTLRWAEEVLAVEDQLHRDRHDIADALQATVGGIADAGLRRGLLGLRRDVFNLRLPRDLAAAHRLTAHLDPTHRTQASTWLDLRVRYQDLLQAGEGIHAAETEARRHQLREVAADPRLRHGILLASPSLDQHLPTYLSAPAGPLGKRARRIERSLLEYVYRTACKTSPFSTLTTVALGEFGADPRWAVAADPAPGRHQAQVRLNVAALARIADAVTSDATLRADLPVAVTSGSSADSSRVRYVRRTRVAGGDDAAVTFDSLREDLFYLSHGTVLKEVIALLAQQPQLSMRELAERIHQVDPDQRDPDEVDAYLHHLLRLGLLTVPLLQIDMHSDNPLHDFRDGVARLGQPWSRRLVGRLDTALTQLDRYSGADLDGRRQVVRAVRDELVQGQRELGAAQPTTPRTLVFEDVYLPEAKVVADRDGWEAELLPALRELSRILPAFDLMLPHRLALKGYFLARFGRGGRCDDILNFVHEFYRDFYEQFARSASRRRAFTPEGDYVPQDNWLHLPEVEALDNARREVVRRMREAHAALPSPDDELVLGDDFIAAVTSALPPAGLDFDPRSFLLQVAAVQGRPLGVLNRSYSGLTLLFSRFAGCFADAGDGGLVAELRQALADVQPTGTVFAELTGGYDTTNLNLHPSITPYELVCPGETSSRPAAAQIPIEDLVISHDEEGDRICLHSRRLGVEIIPAYLGYLLPMALPDVQRALLLFSPTSAAPLDLWGGTDPPLEGETIGGHPRVRFRNLVLVRRTWKIHPRYLPQRGDGTGKAEWFLAWQRWRRDNSLPRRVFTTIDSAPLVDEPGGDRAFRQPIKPHYVDFESSFSLSLLENLVAGADRRVVMSEMLPDVDQLWLTFEDGRYVTEQIVEITGARRPLGVAR